MRWSSSSSAAPLTDAALASCIEQVVAGLQGAAPDLLLLFVSPHHAPASAGIAERLRAELPGALLLGTSAQSVIGGRRELEAQPGIALAAAALPGVALRGLHLDPGEVPAASAESTWREHGVAATGRVQLLLLGDPFSFDAETFLRGLDRAVPDHVTVGGLASGGSRPGSHALFLDDRIHTSGAVGVSLTGNLQLDTVVAQGCRPIGTPMFVTRCSERVLYEVDGRTPLEVLQELYERADRHEQALLQSGLFAGIQMRSDPTGEYGVGDFLVRNLLGMDRESGALEVAAELHEGQVLQFQLRDARSAAADLEARLRQYAERTTGPAEGALLFSCLGRGRGLYGIPDHDSELFRHRIGDLPLAGFFGNGEIGPVERETFLHSYTSAFAIFSSPDRPTQGGAG